MPKLGRFVEVEGANFKTRMVEDKMRVPCDKILVGGAKTVIDFLITLGFLTPSPRRPPPIGDAPVVTVVFASFNAVITAK